MLACHLFCFPALVFGGTGGTGGSKQRNKQTTANCSKPLRKRQHANKLDRNQYSQTQGNQIKPMGLETHICKVALHKKIQEHMVHLSFSEEKIAWVFL